MLYDNKNDPFQKINLVNQLNMADVQSNLDSRLQKILEEQGDLFESPEALRERWFYKIDEVEAIPYISH